MTPTHALARLRADAPPTLQAWLTRRRAQALAAIERATRAPQDVRVEAYVDWFKLTDAPYELEDRVSESGRSYTAIVYTPEAYTEEHMVRSSETGKLVRWAVRLSDGRVVSQDGLIRLRFPEQWERHKASLTRLRGEKKQEAVAQIVWKGLTPEEREAMIQGFPWAAYADARGLSQADTDARQALRDSGSLLAHVDLDVYDRLKDVYAQRLLGGNVGSPWFWQAPWSRFLAYKAAVAGAPVEGDALRVEAISDPALLPLFATRGKGDLLRPHPWLGALSEYLGSSQRPAGERAEVARRVRARLGGPITWQETESAPSAHAERVAYLATADARLARMAPQDRELVKHGTGSYFARLAGVLKGAWPAQRVLDGSLA